MTSDGQAKPSALATTLTHHAPPMWRSKVLRLLAVLLGCLCLAVGMIGAFLPLLPATPFFLCAAACFASANPRLEAWLLSFEFIRRPVHAWRDRGAIALPAKVIATLGMSASLGFLALSGAAPLALAAGGGFLALCAIFIWTRPA